MKRVALIAFLLCGCVAGQKSGSYPSTAAVQMAVEAAAGSTRKAAQSTASARESLRIAAAKSKALLTVARPEDRPLMVELQTALENAQTEMEATQVQLASASGALADSSGQLETLHGQIAGMADALSKAREESDREKAAHDFWRACTWKLGLLAVALGLWTFRKPLLAVAGL